MNELILENNKSLPSSWTRSKLDNLCELIGGGTPSRNNLEYFGGNIIWLTPTEIPKNMIVPISDSKEKITNLGLKKSSAKIIPKESVLLTSRASIGYVAIAGKDVTTNQGFASFICHESLFNYYLAYWLWGNKKNLESEATGTTFKEISKSKLKELIIPLPPLNEQKRIVAKIEELFSLLESTKEILEKTKILLKQYRQSLLKSAFEGKLMPQDPNDEPSSILLEKIRREKDSKSKMDFGMSKLILEKNSDTLPKGWLKTELNNTVYILDGKRIPVNSTEREMRKGNVPYYGATGQVGWIDDYLFNEEIVLLGEDGAPFFKNFKDKAYLINGKSWVNNHAHVIKGISDLLLNKFLCHYLNQIDYHAYVNGTTRLKLNQSAMKQIPILLPPLNEQKRIVAKIEESFSLTHNSEKLVDSLLLQNDSMKNSILKQAFEGKLVPQDPNDEPAEILLEKIKAEKEQLIQKQKASRSTKNVK